MSVWNFATEAILRADWELGLTAGQIASKLGISRNAVLGKKWRLGLPNRKIPLTQDMAASRRRATPQKHNRTGATLAPRPIFMPPPEEIVGDSSPSILTITSKECHAVIGKGEDNLARYCGEPVHPGTWCCPGHFGKFYYMPFRR